MTDSLGTVASETAVIILAPWRMIPCRSTSVPTMNPGTSARKTSGIPNASQHQMKRAALSAESTNNAPPLCIELLATMPIGRPSSSAKPTISSAANNGLTSKKLSASTTRSMSSCMSNATCSSIGTTSAVSGRGGGSAS